ncbi:alanine racemase [Hirsutella rhossiliensis]|uniref:Alanine racemase n=1 Tax=Hirsutella rhossiliensis TaxID=111463 RepID=A0A9P8MZM8_9HYPO|nr:alanine racemase [Hirsutella rhossiliensis]KAH0964978.1 alanine racemase [Hirsutella rhossiliensis]
MRILPGATAGDEPSPKTAEDKNQHRRMQVRRAQIHHRQRKANHVKQLELDVCQLRDLIALAKHDARALERQNDDMRAVLRTGADRRQQPVAGPPPRHSWPLPEPASPEMFGGVDVDDLTVTLGVSDAMGTPCFQISPRSSSSGRSPSIRGSSPSESLGPEAPLTPEQEQRAINFILALEHICWNHFAPGDFHSHTHQSEKPRGHALTASAYLMASAPESVYKDRNALKSSWPAPAMTLASLLGLARSLNPGDKETTPVQAWFELASRYPVGLLLGGDALEALLREFKGVVHCIHFGAVMERMAFESVVMRVLGPPEAPVCAAG